MEIYQMVKQLLSQKNNRLVIYLKTPISFNVLPTMALVADFTKDWPKHFEIKGTVLEALGFTSIIKTDSP